MKFAKVLVIAALLGAIDGHRLSLYKEEAKAAAAEPAKADAKVAAKAEPAKADA